MKRILVSTLLVATLLQFTVGSSFIKLPGVKFVFTFRQTQCSEAATGFSIQYDIEWLLRIRSLDGQVAMNQLGTAIFSDPARMLRGAAEMRLGYHRILVTRRYFTNTVFEAGDLVHGHAGQSQRNHRQTFWLTGVQRVI